MKPDLSVRRGAFSEEAKILQKGLQIGDGWLAEKNDVGVSATEIRYQEACKLKFRLRELTSCLCSLAAWAICFESRVAGLDTTETGNEVSQPTLQFTSLLINFRFIQFLLDSQFLILAEFAMH